MYTQNVIRNPENQYKQKTNWSEGIIITHEIINSRLTDVKLMDEEMIINDIEEIISGFNLTITQKTTLSTMKGSIHYHLKLGKSTGLLELTYWPQKKRLWVEIHHNRQAEWNKNLIKPFSERLSRQFLGQIEENIN